MVENKEGSLVTIKPFDSNGKTIDVFTLQANEFRLAD